MVILSYITIVSDYCIIIYCWLFYVILQLLVTILLQIIFGYSKLYYHRLLVVILL